MPTHGITWPVIIMLREEARHKRSHGTEFHSQEIPMKGDGGWVVVVVRGWRSGESSNRE